ncbi:MAG: AbrB/MazE/SpoVT family DNA-binding domain-containing protein [Spirochaetales bacterium]
MVAKMTSKNQITIPKAIASVFSSPYFEVRKQGESIVLTPVNPNAAAQVRTKLDELGITEQDIQDAVSWARQPK